MKTNADYWHKTSIKAQKAEKRRQERIDATPDQIDALSAAQEDTDAMIVDLTYQMTLMALGLIE